MSEAKILPLKSKRIYSHKKMFFTAWCAQILLVRLKQFRDLGTWAVLRNKNESILQIQNSAWVETGYSLFTPYKTANLGTVPGCLTWRT